jgi:hypothetical protein
MPLGRQRRVLQLVFHISVNSAKNLNNLLKKIEVSLAKMLHKIGSGQLKMLTRFGKSKLMTYLMSSTSSPLAKMSQNFLSSLPAGQNQLERLSLASFFLSSIVFTGKAPSGLT